MFLTRNSDESTYTKHGFSGLNIIGKAAFLAILIAVAAGVWIFWAKADFAVDTDSERALFATMCAWAFGVAKIVGIAVAAAYAAHFLLPKRTFQRQRFFCADCGRLLGFVITQCNNIDCRSNRYTTDEELALRRAHLYKQKQTQQTQPPNHTPPPSPNPPNPV